MNFSEQNAEQKQLGQETTIPGAAQNPRESWQTHTRWMVQSILFMLWSQIVTPQLTQKWHILLVTGDPE